MTVKKVVITHEPVELSISGATLLSRQAYQYYKHLITRLDEPWWLRNTTGECALYVDNDHGVWPELVSFEHAVRPVLKLSGVSEAGLEPGEIFLFGGKSFLVLSDIYAICLESIGDSSYGKIVLGATYDDSIIKVFVDDWFKGVCEA